MSDREKGLEKAVEEALPRAAHSYCAQHIAANIQVKFGLIYYRLFWSVAYAYTKEAYYAMIVKLKKENKLAVAYIYKLYSIFIYILVAYII